MLETFTPKKNKIVLIFGNEIKGISQKIIDITDTAVEIKQYGTGTQSDILWLTFENSLAFFPSMIRVTLAVLFVNTQILSVLLVQVIKEFIIFALVYLKLLNKRKEEKFQPEDIQLEERQRFLVYSQLLTIMEL